MRTVATWTPGSGAGFNWIIVPDGFSVERIIVPGSWVIVVARFYRGKGKGGCEKILQSTRRGLP